MIHILDFDKPVTTLPVNFPSIIYNDFNLDFFRLTFFTPINRNMLK